jgi:hypothetical protein
MSGVELPNEKVTEHEVPGGVAQKGELQCRTALDYSGQRSITLEKIGGENTCQSK